MNLTLAAEEFRLFRDFIEKECGIAVNEDKVYLVENRLMQLVLRNGCTSFGDFYLKVKSSTDGALKMQIVDAMTTNETLWFRDESPFKILKECLFPEFVAKLQSGAKSQIRIWCAACSSGQEPYSIVMTAKEFCQASPSHAVLKDKLSILATDISPTVLLLAKSGRYDPIAMSRGMPPEYKTKYFTQQDPVCIIKDEVKQFITFQQFNLQNPFTSLGKFDVIFLRNVAIYFSIDFKTELFKKIGQSLNPGGYLFVGASESLNGYSTDFTLKEHGRGLYYQVKH